MIGRRYDLLISILVAAAVSYRQILEYYQEFTTGEVVQEEHGWEYYLPSLAIFIVFILVLILKEFFFSSKSSLKSEMLKNRDARYDIF